MPKDTVIDASKKNRGPYKIDTVIDASKKKTLDKDKIKKRLKVKFGQSM